jgi:acetyltransferase-like isoleucine patch superfamily enzyme
MKKTQEAVTGHGASLRKYQHVIVGSLSLFYLMYFEWCILLGSIPGALGMILRKIFWPHLFGTCGKGTMFGNNIVLRHPSKIHLGRNVIISEQCVLDGRSDQKKETIVIGDDVILSNQVTLSCKEGSIQIGQNTGINSQTIVQSTNDCPVVIGMNCIIGQRCLIVGGGNYNFNRLDIPIREQGIRMDGGVTIGEDVWLGANVTVLGGVTMGRGSIAAAGAVVTKSISERGICMGVPAKTIRFRGQNETPEQSC